jgi:hypothetical protein
MGWASLLDVWVGHNYMGFHCLVTPRLSCKKIDRPVFVFLVVMYAGVISAFMATNDL